MKKQRNIFKFNKKYKLTAFLLAVALLCLALSGSVTLAKYIIKVRQQGYIESPNFYFSSNLLSEDANKTYSLSMDTTSVSFELYNTVDDLRYSGLDINYNITVSGGGSLSKTSGKLVKNEKSSDTITLSGMVNGGTYVITVTGNAGYEVVLKATFTVANTKTGFYMNVDESNETFVLLTIWSEYVTGPVSITIPNGLIPDNTDPIMSDIINYDPATGKYGTTTFIDNINFVCGYSSYTYRFFKTNDYNKEDFVVKINGATNATLGLLN